MVLPQGSERMAGLASCLQQCAKSQRPMSLVVIDNYQNATETFVDLCLFLNSVDKYALVGNCDCLLPFFCD